MIRFLIIGFLFFSSAYLFAQSIPFASMQVVKTIPEIETIISKSGFVKLSNCNSETISNKAQELWYYRLYGKDTTKLCINASKDEIPVILSIAFFSTGTKVYKEFSLFIKSKGYKLEFVGGSRCHGYNFNYINKNKKKIGILSKPVNYNCTKYEYTIFIPRKNK